MSNIERIHDLVKAGYTKAEIDAMILTPDDPAEGEPAAADPAPTPAEPEPVNDPEPAAEPSPSETLPAGELSGFMQELRQSIADLTAAVQSSNIKNNSIDTTLAEEQEKLLAAYINPPRTK